MATKKKNPVKEVQPRAVKLNAGVDLNEIGKMTITVSSDAPKIQKKEKGADGKMITNFAPPGEDGGTISQRDILQPFILEADVKKIGISEWRVYSEKPWVFTTVVNGRRFKMYAPEFMRCKDKGLVIQIG